ncbi:FUSC family protein [Vulcanococcus limneticus]|uniref:FUSC family protein n=1 Tax=Vulcanococcus limneticus TaxID=2170428 RepID=UPI00398BBD03
MTSRTRPVLLVLVVVICLVLAEQMARGLGIERAGGLLCLANLATLVIGIKLGWRQALLGVGSLALLTIPAVLSQSDPAAGTVVMTLTALALGLSARWQLQPVFWLMVVSLCLLITNSPLTATATTSQLTRLVIGVLASGSLTTLLLSKLLPRQDGSGTPGPFAVAHSWRRALAYGALLAATTLITTPIALQHHWHINGLWMILTPFLVLRPFVRDAWRVALHRSLGTLAGVGLVILLAPLLPPTLPLQVPAIAMAAITAAIAARQGHPALMVTALTATIVLFNSNAADLPLMADKRLLACAIGIAISLGVMALAHPIEQRFRAVRTGQEL